MTNKLIHVGPRQDGALAAYVAGLAHGFRQCWPGVHQELIHIAPNMRGLPTLECSVRLDRVRGLRIVEPGASPQEAIKQLRLGPGDCVHMQCDASPSTAVELAWIAEDAARAGARVSVTAHRVVPDGLDHGQPVGDSLLSLLGRADCISVHSSPVLHDLLQLQPKPRARVVQHSEFYGDMSVFFDGDVPDASAHNARPEVLFFGYMHATKGLTMLLEAFQHVRASLPDAVLTLRGPCGDPGLRRVLRSASENAPGIDVSFDFVPSDRIPALIASSWVVALPYSRATQSSTLAWTRAGGRPALLTDCAGFSDLWASDRTGIFVSPSDPVQFATHLIRLLQQEIGGPRSADRIRQAGQSQSWAKIADELRQAFSGVDP